jgi:hypothetical protein
VHELKHTPTSSGRDGTRYLFVSADGSTTRRLSPPPVRAAINATSSHGVHDPRINSTSPIGSISLPPSVKQNIAATGANGGRLSDSPPCGRPAPITPSDWGKGTHRTAYNSVVTTNAGCV